MLSINELRYTLALQRVPNLGETSAKKLLHKIGSAEGIFKEKKQNLLKIEGIGAFRLKHLNERAVLDEAEEEMAFISANNIDVCYFQDNLYPDKLKHCADGPLLLFQQGNIDIKAKKIISIVGTRKCTSYGSNFCEELIEAIAPLAPVIVSGFAYGIDITAHKAAVNNNLQTIGCLAHGLNRMYPKIHKKYVKPVEENGGFLTEFWSNDAFDRKNFLKRNRVIAGMSEATIVIESANKGGSLVTADIANSYNREVFAVPGRVTDRQSEGCNNLIKTQQAHVLTSAADLLYILGWDLEAKAPKPKQMELFEELAAEEKQLHAYLASHGKKTLDVVALNCDLPTHKVASILLTLELKGLIRPLPGKLFEAL